MNRRRQNGQVRGFTLLEVLLVIAILGVLAGAVAFALGGTQKTQEINLTKILVNETVPQALERYKFDNKKYPDGLKDLVPSYLKSAQTVDPWGAELQYSAAGDSYTLFSKGPGGGGDGAIYKTE